MQELDLIVKNDSSVGSSLGVSKNFNKRHSNVIRDIETILRRNKELNKEFKLSFYTDTRGKKNKNYLISKKGFEILEFKYKLRMASNSLEKEYLKIISDIFPNEEKEYQKKFLKGKYKVDLYFKNFNMIIEIDEKEHLNKKEYDLKRDEELMKELVRIVKDNDELRHLRKKTSIIPNSVRLFI